MRKLPPHFKAKWIEALRSGEYKQISESLRSYNGFCCLGVACHLYDPNQWLLVRVPADEGVSEDDYTLVFKAASGAHDMPSTGDVDQSIYEVFTQYIGATSDTVMYHLANMNDGGYTFGDIADWIEENL